MTLFTAEGLIRAHRRWVDRGICDVAGVVRGAYWRWLLTQGGALGSLTNPLNDSRGCGAVMRAAPIGLSPLNDPFALGCEIGAITHVHPTGCLASGALALFPGGR
jgi:ADP-ribosylglycohydrolase